MGALIRAYDWDSSSLGPPSLWPQSLKTALRLMLSTQHPLFIWWSDDLLQFYNDAYRQSFGPEQHPAALGQRGEVCWPKAWPILGPQIAQVMRGDGASWQENALVPVARHGHTVDVYWTYCYSPIDEPSASTGVGGVLVVCNETTSTAQVAQQLAKEREQLAQIFEQTPSLMAMLCGPEHRFELASQGFMRLVGDREVIGKTWAEALPDAVEQGYLALLDEVYRTGVSFSASSSPYAVQAVAGGPVRQRYLDFVYQPIKGADGNITGIFVEGVDSTERALANAALRESEARLRELNADLERQIAARSLERGRTWLVNPDMLSVLSWAGLFESTNPAWHTGLGWLKQELVGAPYANLVHPDDLSESLAAFAQLRGGQQVLRFENRYRDKSGNYRWLSWVVVPEVGRFYCSARDITEQKAQAAALSQAGEQLRQAQKMEAVGQLTGGIAHDFNNLLTGVTGSLELIERRCATGQLDVESVLRLTSVAKGAAKRAAALTHRLLAFSRRQTLAPDPTDVDHLVAGMQDLIQRTVGPAITMRFSPQAAPWTVLVDKNQLENALLNLCINARDAMPHGGTLEIASRNMQLDQRHALRLALAPGDYLRLTVADTGVGMTPEVMQRAFDPFFTTKPLGEGTGLGLSMIYGFARQSGGQARLKSDLGRGTQVSIYLPRHGELASALDAAAPPHRAGAVADGETILLVDDEATVRLFVAEVLSDSGYEVLEAADAAQGLDILRSNRPIALLVTDVGLPGGTNGRQLADAARVLRPGLQVLFITGYSESALWQAGSLPGGMEVLVKPFDLDDLSARVEHLMAPQRALH